MKFCPKCDRRFEDGSTSCADDGSPLLFVPQEDLTGMVIDDRFKVQRMLGEGGMGCVYLAFQFSVNREVALKVVRRELAHQ
jgi:eukaryotic-like serine/threonine-protein kinase